MRGNLKRRPRAPLASERVRREWLRRVEAEYRSAAITQELVLWLIQIGASPDLIRDGLRIVSDELRHAELSSIVYRQGGGQEPPQIVRESLSLPRRTSEPLEHDVARTAVEVFCLSETLAVRLFKELRSGCRVVQAKRALDRILRDEVRHRDFGWALFGWLRSLGGGEALVALAQRELPAMLGRLRASYAPAAARSELEIRDSDRVWGLMPTARYAAILEQSFERDYLPRFARLGIDVQLAWSKSEEALNGAAG